MSESKQKIPPELQPKVASLNRAIFMREAQTAATIHAEILAAKPDYLLRPPVQYDLARLLEIGGMNDAAFTAYRAIIEKQPENSAYAPALKAAGQLAWKLHKYEECREYLEAFLETNPTTPDRQDCEEVLSRLPPETRRKARSGETTSKSDSVSVEVPSSGSWMTSDSGRPVTFEWSVKKKKPGESSSSRPAAPDPEASHAVTKQPRRGPAETPNPAAMPREYDFESDSPDRSLQPYRGSQSDEVVKLGSDIHKSDTRKDPAVPPSTTSQRASGTIRIDLGGIAKAPAAPAERPAPPAAEPPSSISSPFVKEKAPTATPPGQMTVPPDSDLAHFAPPAPMPKSEKSRVRVVGARKEDAGESGIVAPGEQKAESPEQRYDRLRDGQFALLLPFGKRIHLDAVAQLVSAREGIGEAQAKKLVLKRKGILYDKLTLAEVLELHPLASKCRQSLVFVNVPRNLRPYEHYDVLSAEAKEPGLKMTTDAAVRRIRWSDIMLINSGYVGSELLVSILGSDPVKEYRFFESEFDYPSFSPAKLKSLREGLVEFLGVLSSNAVKALRSHTVENLLKAKVKDPQVFSIHEEYDYYTNWLLFSHYGETVDAAELVEQSNVTSNW